MSALGFEVHIDKENETPAAVFNKGAALKSFGPRRDNIAQPTPRKALFDVNNENQLSASRVGRGKQAGLSGEFSKPSKPGLKISSGVENQSSVVKKPESKKVPHKKVPKKTKAPETDTQPPKVQAEVQTQKVAPTIVVPPPDDDEEYDSDSIFPRSQRLSTYMDKLFTWRPPCLFGTIPDSESDLSDPEDLLHEDILDLPMPEPEVATVSDEDLYTLLVPLPELHAETTQSPLHASSQNSTGHRADQTLSPNPFNDSDLSLTPSPDTSLSLGSLRVMHGTDLSTVSSPSPDEEFNSPSF